MFGMKDDVPKLSQMSQGIASNPVTHFVAPVKLVS